MPSKRRVEVDTPPSKRAVVVPIVGVVVTVGTSVVGAVAARRVKVVVETPPSKRAVVIPTVVVGTVVVVGARSVDARRRLVNGTAACLLG
jgi:hypothetical protein